MATKKKLVQAAPAADDVTLYDELLDAVRIGDKAFVAKKHKRETDDQYLARMVKIIADISDTEFDGLSKEVAEWYEAGVAAMKGKQSIAHPSGYGESAAAQAADEAPEPKAKAEPKAKSKAVAEDTKAEPDAEKEAPAKRKGNPEALAKGRETAKKNREEAAARGEKVERKPREPKERKVRERKSGFTVREIRRQVVLNPKVTTAEIIAMAQKAGVAFTPATANIARQSTLTVIELAKEEGFWKAA